MSLYAIADLHLSFCPSVRKPMDIYGPRWHDHAERLARNWNETIRENDTVIIPGDISWGLKLEEAKYDLDRLAALPGHKVLIKGNHDLWWSGVTKLNSMYDNITFLQNDVYEAEGMLICGSRGWLTPDNEDYTESDERIYKRELLRLRASLDRAVEAERSRISTGNAAGQADAGSAVTDGAGGRCEILVAMHFPPVSKPTRFSGFQQILEDYGVRRVIYGHIHGEEGFRAAIKGMHHGIDYQLVSLDYLNCKPVLIR